MIKVVTSNEMREMDRHTIEDLGVPGVVLMENAGVGTYRIIQKTLENIPDPVVVIFCGKGNNGGDGYVVARHLWDAGFRVRVFTIGKKEDLGGDALTNFNIVNNFGISHTFISKLDQIEENLDEYPDLLVDALLGTGIKGAVRGFMKEVIEYVNGFECPVVSVDVPSGLNADSPAVEGAVIHAQVTVTMALPKRCHIFYPARAEVGELYIADIGIPYTVRNGSEVKVQMVEKSDIHLPARAPDSHKYQNGRVAVLAGCPGYTGAAALASEAALRTGAGMVILAVPEALNPILESKVTEVITRPYPSGDNSCLNSESLPELRKLLEWCDILAIGPGLGRHPETRSAVVSLLSGFDKPAVVDADALFALAHQPEVLHKPHPHWILTPHLGEFSRFLPNVGKVELKKEFLSAAQEFTTTHRLNLLLKGAPSIVVNPEGEIYVNSTGNAALASAGTGDVLTGMAAGLLAQGMGPLSAAFTANYIHGLIADEILSHTSAYSLAAGDLIENMGFVLKKHFGANQPGGPRE